MPLSQFSIFRVFQEQNGEWPAAVHVGEGIASLFAALAALEPKGAISILPEDHYGDPHANDRGDEPQRDTSNWSLWFFSDGRWNWRQIGAQGIDGLALQFLNLLNENEFEVRELRIVPPGALEPRAF